jgi:hypothetical protein
MENGEWRFPRVQITIPILSILHIDYVNDDAAYYL